MGLPPLSGFVGKFLVLRAALAEPSWPWVLALVLTSGLLGMIALGRSGSLLFFRAVPASPPAAREPDGDASTLPVVGLLALCLLLLAASGPAVSFCRATADQLRHPQGYIQAVLGAPPAR